MVKYIIEGGLDFYEELYKSLDDSDQDQDNDTSDNLCQITGQPLTDRFITMEYKHTLYYKHI